MGTPTLYLRSWNNLPISRTLRDAERPGSWQTVSDDRLCVAVSGWYSVPNPDVMLSSTEPGRTLWKVGWRKLDRGTPRTPGGSVACIGWRSDEGPMTSGRSLQRTHVQAQLKQSIHQSGPRVSRVAPRSPSCVGKRQRQTPFRECAPTRRGIVRLEKP